MGILLGLVVGFSLAYANGANDNFKGVATLFGSGTTNYKHALLWATLTTALGSFSALVLAKGLIMAFSGKGLVPPVVLTLKSFPLAVGLSAVMTVILATRYGFPISTTHALVGGLIGAGLMASTSGIQLKNIFGIFFLPLLVSPLIAMGGTILFHPILRTVSGFLGIHRKTCLCIGTQVIGTVPQGISTKEAILSLQAYSSISVDTEARCVERYEGDFFGVSVGTILDRLHYLSAGAVSFARGLNDTPKIAAIILAGTAFHPAFSIAGIGLLMAMGGIISARKVAETMSHRITDMNHVQGLMANLITSVLVIFASKFGMPVSTTHVSCGSLFGIGVVTGQAKWKTITGVVGSWLITLPVAAIFGSIFFLILKEVIV